MADNDGLAAAAAMLAADDASMRLGIELVELAVGRARLRMRVTEAMLNGHRICHGGYVFLLADTAFAVACNTYGRSTVAAGGDVTFLQPVGAGEVLVADAVERARYGNSGLYDVSVAREDGTVVAEFRGRSRMLRTATGTELLAPAPT
ncbi:MAG TPA: hydroxyphenylacetyl-CoA thioesterase PaaI, partial [Micromonosporaceae bacterium]|nr:hydroxyphenylacetyl-CoA thioesterase PaaI [Micromonosporaceae bacterium]